MDGWGPFSLEGKSAVVTGGAMGIGAGIAERLAEAGANVLVIDLDGAAAEQTASRISAKGAKAVSLQLDVTAEDAGERIVAKCEEQFGGVDVLVNNAGIYPQVPALQMDRAMFRKVIAINLEALVFISKAVGQRMADQDRGGKIVNIASIDAIHPSMVGLAAYDSSKGGVLMFTKSFALEMGPKGVQVNAIAPGGIATPGASKPLEGSGMTEEQMKAMTAAFVARIPAGRMGVPDDIAKMAVVLASSASDYMTGEIVVVDGGMLLS